MSSLANLAEGIGTESDIESQSQRRSLRTRAVDLLTRIVHATALASEVPHVPYVDAIEAPALPARTLSLAGLRTLVDTLNQPVIIKPPKGKSSRHNKSSSSTSSSSAAMGDGGPASKTSTTSKRKDGNFSPKKVGGGVPSDDLGTWTYRLICLIEHVFVLHPFDDGDLLGGSVVRSCQFNCSCRCCG
jgi:hypothetical protein